MYARIVSVSDRAASSHRLRSVSEPTWDAVSHRSPIQCPPHQFPFGVVVQLPSESAKYGKASPVWSSDVRTRSRIAYRAVSRSVCSVNGTVENTLYGCMQRTERYFDRVQGRKQTERLQKERQTSTRQILDRATSSLWMVLLQLAGYRRTCGWLNRHPLAMASLFGTFTDQGGNPPYLFCRHNAHKARQYRTRRFFVASRAL